MGLVLPAAAIAAAWALSKRAPIGTAGDYSAERGDPLPEPTQLPSPSEQLATSFDPTTWQTGTIPGDLADQNVAAFLKTLKVSELGQALIDASDNGYNVMFGGATFASYADHPRQYFRYTDLSGRTIRTSAAGAYQFIVPTWDALRARMGLPDFSPASQDAAALELIRERGAYEDVRAGRFTSAIAKCRGTWASLPGSNVDQPTNSLDQLAGVFAAAGGTITDA